MCLYLGKRHCKVAGFILVEVTSLYLTDNGNRSSVKTCYTSDNGIIVAEMAVAVHFIKVREHKRYIVLYGRSALGVDQLKAFPRSFLLVHISDLLFIIAVELEKM